ncbi:MAG TPA: hypothetical protein VGH65_04220, partial [Verrucomicrobiaceae bacterium]
LVSGLMGLSLIVIDQMRPKTTPSGSRPRNQESGESSCFGAINQRHGAHAQKNDCAGYAEV